jgi:hypothetical protein
METVRQFSEVTTEQQALAGGKGGTLARLFQAGFPVPDGFVILPSAFEGDELIPEAWIQVPDGFVILPSAFEGDELIPEAWIQVRSQLELHRRKSPNVLWRRGVGYAIFTEMLSHLRCTMPVCSLARPSGSVGSPDEIHLVSMHQSDLEITIINGLGHSSDNNRDGE